MHSAHKGSIIRLLACFQIVALIVLLPVKATFAQDSDIVEILPAKSLSAETSSLIDFNNPTHTTISLTPDKSEILKLDKEAATIIVGNPNHLNVLADNAKTLVLVGRAPGATHFAVLGRDGAVLMQRHVIVASPKKQYVRIRRSCAAATEGCQETQVYYCPDMCHEILLGGGQDEADVTGSRTMTGEQAENMPPQPISDVAQEEGP